MSKIREVGSGNMVEFPKKLYDEFSKGISGWSALSWTPGKEPIKSWAKKLSERGSEVPDGGGTTKEAWTKYLSRFDWKSYGRKNYCPTMQAIGKKFLGWYIAVSPCGAQDKTAPIEGYPLHLYTSSSENDFTYVYIDLSLRTIIDKSMRTAEGFYPAGSYYFYAKFEDDEY